MSIQVIIDFTLSLKFDERCSLMFIAQRSVGHVERRRHFDSTTRARRSLLHVRRIVVEEDRERIVTILDQGRSRGELKHGSAK